MTQSQLNRAVADATGETVTEIKRLGFGLADPDEVSFDPEPAVFGHELEAKFIDWDRRDAERYVPLVLQPAA